MKTNSIQHFRILIISAALLFTTQCAWAQLPAQRKDHKNRFFITLDNTTAGQTARVNVQDFLRMQLGRDRTTEFRQASSIDNREIQTERFQVYYKGIRVEHATVTVIRKNGSIHKLSGELPPDEDHAITPNISPEAAFQFALKEIDANEYKWEHEKTAPPTGELVLVRGKAEQYVLAYKFDIYSLDPLSRNYVYVDATNGNIVFKDAIIKHTDAVGTAATQYSGTRTINTEYANGSYRLIDNTRGVRTYKLNTSNTISYVTDDNNNWTEAEFKNSARDQAALDAHWGAMMTYDYWKTKHNRNSFNNNGAIIQSLVHYGTNYSNAFWDGTYMVYGDGSPNPFTSLDICAHELGHAVTEYTSGLVYADESGALNEGFSDIWAACVEHYAAPEKEKWLLGEEVFPGSYIRTMMNPNAGGQPDTYQGTHWYVGSYDFGGVHTNSGVINYWFYLLTLGGSGTNDHGFNYLVSGIGIEKAAAIAYLTSLYLSPHAEYYDARLAAVDAAEDLYGPASEEAIQTGNAWDAVGVYFNPTVAPTNLTAVANSSPLSVTLSWSDNSNLETGYSIERSYSSTGVFKVIATVAPDAVSFTDTAVEENVVYYYRVRALNGFTPSDYSNSARIVLGNMDVIKMTEGEFVTCSALFLLSDEGVPYTGGSEAVITFTPATPGARIAIQFKSLDFGDSYSEIAIYDGPDDHAPLLWWGYNTIPPDLFASPSNPTGQLSVKYYTYDAAANGWQAQVYCVTLPEVPVQLTATAQGSQVQLSWTDTSNDETGFIIERSEDLANGFHKYAISTSYQYQPTYQTLEVAGANITSYTDEDVQEGVVYQYRIRAKKEFYYSAPSNIAADTLGQVPFVDISKQGKFIIPEKWGVHIYNKLGAVEWMDYDNDNDLDVFVSGYNFSSPSIYIPYAAIYRNDNGTFVDIAAPVSQRCTAAKWGDYDNDGDADLAIHGLKNGKYLTILYRNDNGNFVDVQASLGNPNSSGTLSWIDFDNDRDLDLFQTGYTGGGGRITKLYRNTAGAFSEVNAGLPPVSQSTVDWGDCDDDGDQDLLLGGVGVKGASWFCRVYRNDSGSFTPIESGITPIADGDARWGDYDNDGDLDILISGWGSGSVVYRNDDEAFVRVDLGLPYPIRSSTQWSDYDHDGDLDILLSYSMNIWEFQGGTKIFRNDDGVFHDIHANVLTIIGEVKWGDYDSDGDFDLLAAGAIPTPGTGYDNDPVYSTTIYQNVLPTTPVQMSSKANQAPSVPAGLTASVTGNTVTLSWDKSTDSPSVDGNPGTPQNGITYNLYIRDEHGKFIVSPVSDLVTGNRKLSGDRGNASTNGHWVKNLPQGKYYWSVQAIDHGFAASAFSQEKTFYVGNYPVTIKATHSLARKNETTTVSFLTKDFQSVVGLQFTVNWNPQIATFAGIESADLDAVTLNNFGVNQIHEGQLLFSWTSPELQPQTLNEDAVLFKVLFTATGNPGDSSGIAISGPVEVIKSNFSPANHLLINGSMKIKPDAMISGHVTHLDQPMPGVQVDVINTACTLQLSSVADETGAFSYSVPAGIDYNVSLSKPWDDATIANFLNAADLATIRRHILKTALITEAYHLAASDVSGDQAITTLDKVLVEAVILGMTEFPNENQWRFVPTDHDLNASPFIYPQTKALTNIVEDVDVTFHAIHLGDAVTTIPSPGRTTASCSFDMRVEVDQQANEFYLIVRSDGFNSVAALQASLAWDESLMFSGVGVRTISPVSHVAGNHIRLIWDEPAGHIQSFPNGTELFALRFSGTDTTGIREKVWLATTDLKPIAFSEMLQPEQIQLTWSNSRSAEYKFWIGEAYPNPFNEVLTIKISVTEAAAGSIRITDVSGRSVYNHEVRLTSGENTIIMKDNNLKLPRGAYLLTVQVGAVSKTMTIVKGD